MKAEVGLWIDRRTAIIVTIAASEEEVRRIDSDERVVGVVAADRLTDPQIAAKVREHFAK